MKIRLTKAQIIRALENEPITRLRAGYGWFSSRLANFRPRTVGTFGQTDDCYECAVGAVMRQVISPRLGLSRLNDAIGAATRGAGVTPDEAFTTNEVLDQARAELDAGRAMGALSIAFEGLWSLDVEDVTDERDEDDARADRVRAEVVAFVKGHFPPSVVVDIDGAKPAQDVKPVKERSRVVR